MLYLTPERYRIGGYGQSLDGVEDVELRAILSRASEVVNQHCLVSNRPQKHDFRGGTITGEKFVWDIGNPNLPGKRSVYVRHRPIRSVAALRIQATNTQYVAFNTNELFVTDNSIEIVSLAYTSVGLWGGGVLPAIGLDQPIGFIDYTYGWSFAENDEILEATDARLYRAMNQWWDGDVTPAVYRNGVLVADSEYTIDYDEGTVEFAAAQSSEDTISVSYTYRLPSAIAEATGYIATDMLADRRIAARGMIGVAELAVGEVRIRRDSFRSSTAAATAGAVNDKAEALLAPYRQIALG